MDINVDDLFVDKENNELYIVVKIESMELGRWYIYLQQSFSTIVDRVEFRELYNDYRVLPLSAFDIRDDILDVMFPKAEASVGEALN
jgi:hypothetical protein